MDGGATGSGGGGGPAPFLLKTYDMVDDSSTDDIVGWSFTRKSFVVWNPPEFARVLLPTYFKHNNFSSFIRQLNTYGFRKIDPEKWEFANEDFVKDKKHLLKNIHRRKPIHSHSNPQGTADSERSAYEEEIDKLSREKADLEANVLKFKHQQSTAKVQLQDFTQRISGLEQRQENLLSFLDKAVQNPDFVERLTQRLESMDVSVYNKKRRLPDNQLIHHLSDQVNNMVDDHSSSKPDFGFPHDLCNKLGLELSPALSDMNSPSHCTQSSNEDGENSPMRISDQLQKNLHQTGETLYTPETLELSDARTSFGQKMDSPLLCRADGVEALKGLTPNEEGTSHISCLLKLSLASFPPQISGSHSSTEMVHMADETGTISDTKSKSDGSEVHPIIPSKDKYVSDGNPTLSSSINKKQVPAISPPQANDVFWERFLTERPGCSDNEEASSSFRANPYEELGGRKIDQGVSRNMKSAQHLSL